MNELIQKLAEQAGMVKILEEHASEYGAGTFENTPYPELEKFAELLIQQCINVCEPVLDEPYEDMSEFGKGLVEGQDVAVEKIKRHFGVEE